VFTENFYKKILGTFSYCAYDDDEVIVHTLFSGWPAGVKFSEVVQDSNVLSKLIEFS